MTDGSVPGEKQVSFNAQGITTGDHRVTLEFYNGNSVSSKPATLKFNHLTVTVLAARDSACYDPLDDNTGKPAPTQVTLYKEYLPEIEFRNKELFKGPHRDDNCGGSFLVSMTSLPTYSGLALNNS